MTWKIKTTLFLGELWRNLSVEVRAEAEKGKKKYNISLITKRDLLGRESEAEEKQ